MADILDEIEQDLRKDQMKRFWKRWGWLVGAAAFLVVALVAGWRGYVAWEQSRAAGLGDRFLAAVDSSEGGESDQAIQALDALARDGSGGYPALARFRLASERAAKGERVEALRDFDALAADTRVAESWRDMARLRAAFLLVDEGRLADVAQPVERLAAAGNPYRHSAREALALTALQAGELPVAARWFQQMLTDPEASEGIRNRATLALTMLAADGVTP